MHIAVSAQRQYLLVMKPKYYHAITIIIVHASLSGLVLAIFVHYADIIFPQMYMKISSKSKRTIRESQYNDYKMVD